MLNVSIGNRCQYCSNDCRVLFWISSQWAFAKCLKTTENGYLKVGHHADLHVAQFGSVLDNVTPVGIPCWQIFTCLPIIAQLKAVSTTTVCECVSATATTLSRTNCTAQGIFYNHHRRRPFPIVISPPQVWMCVNEEGTGCNSSTLPCHLILKFDISCHTMLP